MNQTCQSCPYDCYTCHQNGSCVTCSLEIDKRQLNSSSSRCVPTLGYFESNQTVSSPCASVCSACTSLYVCSACSANYYLRNDSMCYAFCLNGYFTNTQAKICEPCPSGCLSCISTTVCSSCIGGYFLRADNLCYQSCEARQYGNTQTTKC